MNWWSLAFFGFLGLAWVGISVGELSLFIIGGWVPVSFLCTGAACALAAWYIYRVKLIGEND